MHAKFWSGNLKGKDHSGDKGVDKRIILEWILKEKDGKVWLKIDTSCGLL
jgi:hypothetical protein